MLRKIVFAIALALSAGPAFAQSQAANGTIEGTVADTQGGVLPGVTVTVSNIDTGLQRSLVTNENGLYRALLLPIGNYRAVAELQGFKKVQYDNLKLSVGATAIVNITMEVGVVSETVEVTSQAPAVELGRIDVGHTMSELEVRNLPQVARNPYNFALAQPGVTGTENVEFGVPRLAANGAAMRINYQIDGNTNTQKDRAGLRLLPLSEVMIQEVKVITTGFAPEFGQTMGMVYNAVTPSGTNTFHGSGGYLFRRRNFSAFPFFFGCGSTTPAANCPAIAATAQKPETKVDTGTATLGGPILKNKLFFYGGWEQTRRDLSSNSLITVSSDIVSQLGLKAQPTAVPNVQTAKFKMAKSDYQLNNANRFTVRWIQFHNDAPYNSGGGVNTVERATDFLDAMDSFAGQAVTTIGNNKLNELRVQYAHRHQESIANSESGIGPSVTITGVAGFGAPLSGTGQGNAGFDFKQNITQVVDNFSYIRGKHSFKAGFDVQHVYDERTAAPQFVYTFPSVATYLSAKSGANPLAYTNMTQITGNLGFNMATGTQSYFVQDDWQLASSLKVLYGVRYDLYRFPDGLGSAPLAQTQVFNLDKNNWGPRLGVAWAINPKTVLRSSTGIMYDQPILGGYEAALQLSGSPKAPAYTYSSAQAGAPAFPGTVSSGTLTTQSPWAIDPQFEVAHTWQANAQLEHAFVNDLSTSIAVMYAKGSQLPVVTDINLINPVSFLADGRPVYATAVNAGTRVDPRFNHIFEVQSIAKSEFKSMTVQASKRIAAGLTFNVQYSFGKGVDNAPIPTQLTVQAEAARTDLLNLDTDKGPNPLDMRHNFTGTIVYTSESKASNAVIRQLLSGNQLGVLMQFNSGLPTNLTSNLDLNSDGSTGDRALGVGRNSIYLPTRKNVDMRFTRRVPIHGAARAEIVAELKNAFNTQQLSSINTTTTTDAAGNPATPIVYDAYQRVNPSGFEQRKFQLGFKVAF